MINRYKTREDKVAEFEACDPEKVHIDIDWDWEWLQRRIRLIREESIEVTDALEDCKISTLLNGEPSVKEKAHLLKELCDLQYVLSGTIVGIKDFKDFDVAFNRVHDSNMTKVDKETRTYKKNQWGKVLKPYTYEDPKLEDLVV